MTRAQLLDPQTCGTCHPTQFAQWSGSMHAYAADDPRKYKGVTCFFCHTIDAIEGSHDAALHSAGDLVMRGEYRDPVANTGHASAYSELHDRDHAKSAVMCGVCHDIVTTHGAPIERTYAEWQNSVFARSRTTSSIVRERRRG